MNGRLRVAVVGCGVQAQLILLPALKNNPLIEIVALCDTDLRKLQLLAKRYQIRRCFTDFDQIKDESDINAVVIATPTYLHAPMVIAALENSKDVLCELPLATTSADAEQMLAVARKKKRRLMPCLATRLRDDVQVLKKHLQQGDLGKIYYAKTGWLRKKQDWATPNWQRSHGVTSDGAFLNLGSALLDTALYLTAPDQPVAITGKGVKHNEESLKQETKSAPRTEDTAFALIRFESGLILTVEVGWSLLMEQDFVYFNLFGTKGAAVLNPLTIHKEIQGKLVNITPQIQTRGLWRNAYNRLINIWVDSLLKDEPPEISTSDALLINKIADAFQRSSETGTEIKLVSRDDSRTREKDSYL